MRTFNHNLPWSVTARSGRFILGNDAPMMIRKDSRKFCCAPLREKKRQSENCREINA